MTDIFDDALEITKEAVAEQAEADDVRRASHCERLDPPWYWVECSDGTHDLVPHETWERIREWRLAFERLTPGGSEFHNDLKMCRAFIAERLRGGHMAKKDRVRLKRRAEELEGALRDLLDSNSVLIPRGLRGSARRTLGDA